MAQNDLRVPLTIRLSRQDKRALELEAERLGTNVHALIIAELFPMLRRIKKRHADQLAHLPQ